MATLFIIQTWNCLLCFMERTWNGTVQ